MGLVIKAELYRLSKGKVIKVFAAISFAFLVVKLFSLLELLFEQAGAKASRLILYGHNAFAALRFDGIFSFFTPFLVVALFTAEFSAKTLRNYPLGVVKRKSIFLGKYFALLIVIFLLTLGVAAAGTILFTLKNGWGAAFALSQVGAIIFTAVRGTLFQMVFANLIILLSLAIHSDSLIIIIFFASSLVESIVAALIRTQLAPTGALGLALYLLPSTYEEAFLQLTVTPQVLLYSFSSIALCTLATLFIGACCFHRMDIRV